VHKGQSRVTWKMSRLHAFSDIGNGWSAVGFTPL